MARASAWRGVEEGSPIAGESTSRAVSAEAVPASAAEYERYQLLVQRAVSVFGDELTASRWLSTASADFDGEVPIRIAQSNGYSLTHFEPIFARIEHGIYF